MSHRQELWRDLMPGEIIKWGDRMINLSGNWEPAENLGFVGIALHPKAHAAQRRVDSVTEQQREELLAAIDEIAKWVEQRAVYDHPISTMARQAIAKARGKA